MTRVISGVVLAAVALAAILFLSFPALRVVVCVVAGLAADEYVRITSPARGLCRWVVIAAVIYACWWAAVPAPLSVVLLAIIVIAWLSLEVLRQARTLEGGDRPDRADLVGAPLGARGAAEPTGPEGPLLLMATSSSAIPRSTTRARNWAPSARPGNQPQRRPLRGRLAGAHRNHVHGGRPDVLFPATPVVGPRAARSRDRVPWGSRRSILNHG
jgi:hypothetical protein